MNIHPPGDGRKAAASDTGEWWSTWRLYVSGPNNIGRARRVWNLYGFMCEISPLSDSSGLYSILPGALYIAYPADTPFFRVLVNAHRIYYTGPPNRISRKSLSDTPIIFKVHRRPLARPVCSLIDRLADHGVRRRRFETEPRRADLRFSSRHPFNERRRLDGTTSRY